MPTQPNLFDYAKNQKDTETWEQIIEQIQIQKDNPNATLLELVPEHAILALTRQYGVQAIHISKILSYLQKIELNGLNIIRDEISDELAITWARTQGTLNVMRKIALITAHNKLTRFGNLVLSYSPYLDNHGLLWIFHYFLSSNATLVLWSYIFNDLFRKNEEISLHDITKGLSVLTGKWSEYSLNKKVTGESGGILKAYLEGFLRPLNLVQKQELGKYYCASHTQNISTLIWLSALLIYRDQYYPGAPSLEVPLIVDGNYSPGRIFRQNEVSVRKALDELHNAGLLTVETRSGLDQVRFKREITWLSAVAQYLKGEAQ